MTSNQQRAIDAIKAATGWDAEPSSQGAKVQRPNVTSIYVWWSRADKWKCEITPKGWTGEGTTPEEAIDAVLPRYRAQIEKLAADILPTWPRLEWTPDGNDAGWKGWRLSFVLDNATVPILNIYNGMNVIGEKSWLIEPAFGISLPCTYAEVQAWVTTYVESLKLRCPIPAFPEIPNA